MLRLPHLDVCFRHPEVIMAADMGMLTYTTRIIIQAKLVDFIKSKRKLLNYYYYYHYYVIHRL